MKKYALILIGLYPMALYAVGQEQDKTAASSFEWGCKIGFAATGTNLSDAYIDGKRITEYTQDTQVGHFFALQFRLNFNRFLIQSGLGISHNKSSFSIDSKYRDSGTGTAKDIYCSYSLHSLTLPIHAGYHIINRSPYYMSVFTGPCMRYTPPKLFSTKIENLDPYQFTESAEKFIVSWTIGMSFQIGRTIFDFEYEQSINDITSPLSDLSGADPVPGYRLDRRIGIISFSYGIMF